MEGKRKGGKGERMGKRQGEGGEGGEGRERQWKR